MKKIFYTIFFVIVAITLTAQTKSKYKHICHCTEEEDGLKENLLDNSTTTSNTPYYKYNLLVSQICSKLGNEGLIDQITLKTNNIQSIASSFCYVSETTQTNDADYITINIDNIKDLVGNDNYKEPAISWVLAHEISHLASNDFNIDPATRYDKFHRELLADKNAGKAIGTIYPNIDIDFFDEVLPLLLVNDSSSLTHPPLLARIMAAKGGWLQSKFSSLNQTEEKTILGKLYKKIYSENDSTIKYGEYNSTSYSFVNFTYKTNIYNSKLMEFHYTDLDKNHYWLEFMKYTYSDGNNVYYIDNYKYPVKSFGMYSISWSTGDYYYGEFYKSLHEKGMEDYYKGCYKSHTGEMQYGEFNNNTKLNGWGKKVYSDGKIEIGQWKDGKANGHLIIIEDNKVITNGIYKDGVFIKNVE